MLPRPRFSAIRPTIRSTSSRGCCRARLMACQAERLSPDAGLPRHETLVRRQRHSLQPRIAAPAESTSSLPKSLRVPWISNTAGRASCCWARWTRPAIGGTPPTSSNRCGGCCTTGRRRLRRGHGPRSDHPRIVRVRFPADRPGRLPPLRHLIDRHKRPFEVQRLRGDASKETGSAGLATQIHL